MSDFKSNWGNLAVMSVTESFGPEKVRHVNTLVNATMGLDFGVHNSNLVNTTRAILERVFLVKTPTGFSRPPQMKRGAERRLKKFKLLLHKVAPSLTKWSHQHFVDAYQGHKRAMYQNACDSLRLKPIDISDSYISAFVKAEKINLTAKPDPAPRIIQPRSPRYNVAVGVYIKPIEGVLYDLIAKVFGSPTVMKGLNADQVGEVFQEKWKQFREPVAIGLDASRFDQHCSKRILKWEHSIYKIFFPRSKELQKLLRWQLHNTGFANVGDGRIKYRTHGCRMSGDMNTGLGNCLIMCALIWSFFKDKCAIELANNGDDCVVIMERQDLHHCDSIPVWFEEMGFTMKVEEPVYELEHVEFCQSRPVAVGNCYRMVRDPKVCLTKDLISVKNLSTESAWRYQCQAISDCGLAAFGDMPIFCEFYKMLDTGYHHKRKTEFCTTGFEFQARGLHHEGGVISDLTRFSFYKAFDITPDMQIDMEELYRGLQPVYRPGPVDQFDHLIPTI